MSQTNKNIGICLFNLASKEEAVLNRVITFSGSQGRHYALADLRSARLVIVSDDMPVDFDQMNPDGSLIVRIADQDSEHPYDVLMARPLLVTRVMRTLDDARKLLLETFADAELEEAVPPPQPAVRQRVQDEDDLPAPVAEPLSLITLVPVVEQPEFIAPMPSVEQTGPVPPPIPLEDMVYHHRALVVDDSAAIRKQLELELRQAGIAADFADSGEQALERVAERPYDIIFLDIIMPGIDGFETCRQMRQRSEMKKTPIIMLSAKTSPLDEVQGVIAGASTYLTKPVRSDQLQRTLKRVSMWLEHFNH